MKVQLFAKNTYGETVLLQLMEDIPVKMNMSVAELNPFNGPTSYYTETFRVPGQGSNGKFFEDAYSVNGSTFNATKAVEAWIMTNGLIFSVGNLILKGIVQNIYTGNLEYEVFFMGDTSDFSTSVGDTYMDQINTDELDHDLTYSAVTTSWGATAGGTAGLKNGNVLYPLCEWGYEYDTANYPINSTVSVGYPKGSTGLFGGSFTNGPTSGLELTQFKPAVRVKWLWDKIFSDAGYSYTSDFINSDLFDKLYMVSDSVDRVGQDIQAGLCNVTAQDFVLWPTQTQRIQYNNAVSNTDLAFDLAGHNWVSPATGLFSFKIGGYGYFGVGYGYPQGAWKVFVYKNGAVINSPTVYQTPDPTLSTFPYVGYWTIDLPNISCVKGDKIWVELQEMPYSNASVVFGGNYFRCIDAPDYVIVSSFFPPAGTVKKIDFIQGISRMFNLVFVPDKEYQRQFNIEPWVDWIEGGSKKDWTDKLDGYSEITMNPVFMDQPRVVQYTGTEDADLMNVIYQDQYKRSYMFREFNSGIKIIRDTEEVKLPFASTPLESIPSKNTQYPDWVIPTLGKLLPGDPAQNQSGKIQPIQPKPRILFYNGLRSNPVNWYLQNEPYGATGTAQSRYPLVSEFSSFPPNNETELDLTFQVKKPLWSRGSSYIDTTGNDLYVKYWQRYTEWIYNPYNRKLRARFKLNPNDVQSLKFNDKIWVKDSWFLITKIDNYPVGETAIVDVDLIKVPDSATPTAVEAATGPTDGTCEGVTYCFNETNLDAAPITYNYIDCNSDLQSLTLAPQTCTTVCSLYPNPYVLPAKMTAFPMATCVAGAPQYNGPSINLTLAATGALADGRITTGIFYASTGATSGPYTPIAYYSVQDIESLSRIIIYPDGYFSKVGLIFANGASGASINSESITLTTNGATSAFASRSFVYQPIEAAYPGALSIFSTYTAKLTLDH